MWFVCYVNKGSIKIILKQQGKINSNGILPFQYFQLKKTLFNEVISFEMYLIFCIEIYQCCRNLVGLLLADQDVPKTVFPRIYDIFLNAPTNKQTVMWK